MTMKILFCGLGSIGTRHLRNLKKILEQKGIEYRIDAVRSSLRQLAPDVEESIGNSYLMFGEVPDDYDIAFVTNPTSLHWDTVGTLARKARHLFIEKPVFAEVPESLDELGLREDGVYYVACPLRHTPLVRRMREIIADNPVSAVRCICSSYLPEWRPGVDYRKNYSAIRELGGGVRLDLIHEWDYLAGLFGLPLRTASFAGQKSPLEITSDDVAVYVAEYPDKLLTLHLDYVGRQTRRELELFCENDVVVGSFTKGTITWLKEGRVETLPTEDFYINEMTYFIDCVLAGRTDNCNTVSHAVEVLRVALR